MGVLVINQCTMFNSFVHWQLERILVNYYVLGNFKIKIMYVTESLD